MPLVVLVLIVCSFLFLHVIAAFLAAIFFVLAGFNFRSTRISQKTKGTALVVTSLLILVTHGLEDWGATKEAKRKAEVKAVEERKVQQAFRDMSPTEHLEKATLLLKIPSEVPEALNHLSAIPDEAPESTKAKQLRSDYEDEQQKRKAEVEKERQEQLKHLPELKRHFNVTRDEFDGKTIIRHKAFSKFMNGNGTTIEADIVNGNIFVESQFVSDDWIFHEQFTVKVGTAQLTASGKTQREVVSGVTETVSPDSPDSALIAALIAGAGKTPVRVRLDGKFYKDYTLRPAHQQAIKETVEYWHLLHPGE